MTDKLSIKDRTGKLLTRPADPDSPAPRLPGQLMTTEELAAYLGNVSVRTLEDWRRQGLGPDFVTISPKMVRYRPGAVDDWVRGLERKSRRENVMPDATAPQ